MADDGGDDDYMGDLSLFLPPEQWQLGANKPPPPVATAAQARARLPKGLPWQERRRRERELRQREEDERTMAAAAAAESAIPETNVGFRLLSKMGYRPDAVAAKPLGLDIRRSRAGLGAVTPAEAMAQAEEGKRRRTDKEAAEMAAEFGSRQQSRWRERRLVANYGKADAALAQLENREVVEPSKEAEGDAKGECEVKEEEEELITEEDLQELLVKLREQHHYCLFCGCKYESAEALEKECPGLNEDDH